MAQRGRILGYILSIVRDPHIAEDVFQDLAILVAQKSENLQDGDSFVGWLYRAARFKSLRACHDRHRFPEPLDEETLDLLDGEWEKHAEEEKNYETRQRLRHCVERLTERSRKLIRLRYGKNMSGKTLAAHMKRPVNTVYVALSRIHRSLRECMNKTPANTRVFT